MPPPPPPPPDCCARFVAAAMMAAARSAATSSAVFFFFFPFGPVAVGPIRAGTSSTIAPGGAPRPAPAPAAGRGVVVGAPRGRAYPPPAAGDPRTVDTCRIAKQ
eukprot:TRINITY_DN4899_c0_g1_i1.p3 TRINITY_DN4899_c0_g1~~TRINITY_DN4899_c0_g1_i1.p3  ORF type:complete len:104 (-),score=7.54 TRINITY_DN4899_c0_g1_i1:41-352(-)